MRAAIEAVKTVGIAVRDATDQVIPAESIWIQETPLPDGISMADMERGMAEAGEVGSFPFYFVSLTIKRNDTAVLP